MHGYWLQFGLDSIGVASVVAAESVVNAVFALLAAPLVQKLVRYILTVMSAFRQHCPSLDREIAATLVCLGCS